MTGGVRVLAIGLDVGDGRLVRSWTRSGHLPHLASLAERGSFGWLETPARTLHVSAWPSLYTGVSPGRHGVYYTFQPIPGEQGAVRFRPGQYGSPTVWELAARAGKRCLVLDAPYTHPVEGGTQVFEWGTWAHYWKPDSVPEGKLEEILRACGRYPLGLEANQVGLAALDPEDLTPRLVDAARAKGRALKWLMASEAWDLCMTVFGETHPAAHYLWPQGLEAAAVEDSPAAFHAVRRVYEAVDAAIGEVLETLEPHDIVLVVSGDGCGPNRAGWHLLPGVLERLGHLVRPGSVEPGEGSSRSRPGIYGQFRRLLPNGLRQAVSRRLPTRFRDALMRKGAADEIDWSRTAAFCLPTDLEGCIRINRRGREPLGIVAPGDEEERTCAEIGEALHALVNPTTGNPAVREVIRTREMLPGEYVDMLPDLVVVWDDSAEIEAVESPAVGAVAAPSPDGRTGTHRAPGFVLACGDGFAPSRRLDHARVVDFAPTVLRLLAVDIPSHMEGRSWTDRTPALDFESSP